MTTTTTAPIPSVVPSTQPRFTFTVDDVAINTKACPLVSLQDTFCQGMGKTAPASWPDMMTMTTKAQDPYGLIGLGADVDRVLQNSRRDGHPLISAVHTAFATHAALTFSPDMIWQTVVQGVAHHILNAPEEHRRQFVSFEGKASLRLTRTDLTLDDLPSIGAALGSIINDFSSLLGQSVTPAYYQALTHRFSTTTPAAHTAAQVACMEAFSPYFNYEMYCGCGFPRITVTGSVEDWRAMKAKVIQIEELFHLNEETNLTWWTSKLTQVVDHFISAAQGQPDIAWWKKMYKQVDVYLDHMFNGWIGWLWPYTKTHAKWDGKQHIQPASPWQRNPMLENISDQIETRANDWGRSPDAKRETWVPFVFNDSNQRKLNAPGFGGPVFKGSCFMYTSDFPIGISSVNLKIVDPLAGKTLDTTLIGGFMGISQDTDGDMGLVPQLGYALLA